MAEEANDDAVVIDTEGEEATESNEPAAEEDAEAIKASLAEALKAKAELTARAKRAEEELKALKAKPQQNNDPQISDELKLIARGLSDEAIDQAKVIAKGKGISLPEAIKDPLFTIYQEKIKDDERKEKAKLGASKGSGGSEEKPKGVQSGATRDEHMKAFKKALGE